MRHPVGFVLIVIFLAFVLKSVEYMVVSQLTFLPRGWHWAYLISDEYCLEEADLVKYNQNAARSGEYIFVVL